jgi:tRNA U55 pseudouridine synthase TruB
LKDIEIPKREVEIFDLKVISWREINSKELLKEIEKKISKVKVYPVKNNLDFNRGDFRQEIILSKWNEVLGSLNINFQIVKIKAEVSSGTYMRTLAHEWGKALGVPALAYHIVRTKVGEFVTHNT